MAFDWALNRKKSIRLLGEYDITRDPAPLVDLVDD